MKAIILAAGLGTRLGEITKTIPKCLLKVSDQTILEYQRTLLNEAGIQDITIVIGAQGECWTPQHVEKIKSIVPKVVINKENAKTNNVFSLNCALEREGNPTELLVLDGDLFFSRSTLYSLIQHPGNVLLTREGNPTDAGNHILLDESSSIKEVGRNVFSPLTYGGMFKITSDCFPYLKQATARPEYYTKDTGFVLHEISQKLKHFPLINNAWVNINTPEDMKRAIQLTIKPFLILTYGYTGVGKSTVAKKIASKIPNTEIFHSALIRKELRLSPKTIEEADRFFDYRNNLREEVDKKVYNELAEKASQAIKEGKNVVLDAGFFFYWQRSLVYDKVKSLSPDIVIIKVVCNDENEIKRRLTRRAENYDKSPLNETPSWNTYLATKKVTQPLDEDLRKYNISIIEYNTILNKLEEDKSSGNTIKAIKNALI